MAKVTFKVDAEEGKAIAAFQKLVDSQRKLEGATRDSNRASRDHHGSIQQMGASAARELGGMVTRWASVGAAVGLVTKSLEHMREEMRRIGEMNRTTTDQMMKALAGAGHVPQQGAVISHLLGPEMAGAGATLPERIAAYQAVAGAMPGAPLHRILDIVSEAAHAGKTGIDRAEFGTAAGELAKMLPSRDPGRVGSLAYLLLSAAGRHGTKMERSGWTALQQWQAAGLGTAEQGMGYLLASLESGQKATGFQTLAQYLLQEQDFSTGVATTPVAAARRRFYGMQPAQRLAALQSDPKLRRAIFGTQAGAIEAMFAYQPEQYAQQALAAQQQDLLSTTMAAALGNPRWRRLMDVQEATARAQVAEYRRDEAAGLDAAALQKAALREAGVPAWLRAPLNTMQDIGAELDLPEAGPPPARLPTGELNQAAKDLRAAAESIRPNPNVHIEPAAGGL